MPPRKPFRYQKQEPYRVNQRIRAREVLLIDPSGESLGVRPLQEAQTLAKRHQLDLVEVSPRAHPPVCKIIDYGKYKYEMAKRDRETKKGNSATKLKELKFRLNIDDHDYSVKMKRSEQFMFKGMKVKMLLMLRGREMGKKDLAMKLMKRIEADLSHVGVPDAPSKIVGRNVNLMLTPKSAKKRERKYTLEDEVVDDVESDDSTEENAD